MIHSEYLGPKLFSISVNNVGGDDAVTVQEVVVLSGKLGSHSLLPTQTYLISSFDLLCLICVRLVSYLTQIVLQVDNIRLAYILEKIEARDERILLGV